MSINVEDHTVSTLYLYVERISLGKNSLFELPNYPFENITKYIPAQEAMKLYKTFSYRFYNDLLIQGADKLGDFEKSKFPQLPDSGTVSYYRSDTLEMVGFGKAIEITFSSTSYTTIDRFWQQLSNTIKLDCHHNELEEIRSTGISLPFGFISLCFNSGSSFKKTNFPKSKDESILIVPKLFILTTNKKSYLGIVTETTHKIQPKTILESVKAAISIKKKTLLGNSNLIQYYKSPQCLAKEQSKWVELIEKVQQDMLDQGVKKVVISRCFTYAIDGQVDVWAVISNLARQNPNSYVYAIDGLFGASPELLAQKKGDQIQSLVLAGTCPSGEEEWFCHSTKDRREHAVALDSVKQIYFRYCKEVTSSQAPFLLRLSKLTHFASRVLGVLVDKSLLEFTKYLHPTAAVAGEPKEVALAIIHCREERTRKRFAGPIGYLDAKGDGELALALRCLELGNHSVTTYAGVGIMPSSEPLLEYQETELKMQVARRAIFG